jgi:hypothetical protein
MSVRKILWKTRRILLAGMAVLTGLVLLMPAFRLTLLGWLRGEPCYAGRPVSYWRYQLRDWRVGGEDLETLEEERQQNEERGFKNFSYVLGCPADWSLYHRDTTAQRAYGELRILKDRLAGHGSCMNPIYGELFCSLAILDGDPAAIPVLIALLRDEDVGIRRHAAAALGTIGPRGQAAFPALLETANRGTRRVIAITFSFQRRLIIK